MSRDRQIVLGAGLLGGALATVLFAYVLDISVLHGLLLVIALRLAL